MSNVITFEEVKNRINNGDYVFPTCGKCKGLMVPVCVYGPIIFINNLVCVECEKIVPVVNGVMQKPEKEGE